MRQLRCWASGEEGRGKRGLDCRVSATADVRRRHETFLGVGATSDSRPSVALVRLDHVELFAGLHRNRTLAWRCKNTFHQLTTDFIRTHSCSLERLNS